MNFQERNHLEVYLPNPEKDFFEFAHCFMQIWLETFGLELGCKEEIYVTRCEWLFKHFNAIDGQLD